MLALEFVNRIFRSQNGRSERLDTQLPTRSKSRRSRFRRLLAEQLESRILLASDWQNPLLNVDVDDDGSVSPLDVLQVINEINRDGQGTPLDFNLPVENNPYFDTDGDRDLSPLDVLIVINYLNQRGEPLAFNIGLQNDSGASSQDFITNDAKIVGAILNVSSVNGTVKARVNRGPVVNVAINTEGKFLFDPSATTAIGDGNFTAKFLLESGGTNRLTKLQLTLDTVPPVLSDPRILQVDDTGIRNDDNITRVARPRIVVVTDGVERVQLRLDSSLLFDGVITAPFILPAQPLSDGLRQLSAVSTDIAGNVATSRLVPLVIDTLAPPVPTLDLAPTSDSGPQGDRETGYVRVTLLGTTEGNSFVTVGGTNESVRTSGDGVFRIPNVVLNAGLNTVSLSVSDIAGNTSSGAANFTRTAAIVAVDPVSRWNQATLEAIRLDATAPPLATRALAMVSIAMLDVVNAIEATPSYLVSLSAPANLSIDAAISSAAFRVMSYLYPGQASANQSVQTAVLVDIPNGSAKTDGVRFGTLIGDAVIALRDQDGWNKFIDFVPGNVAGVWQETAPVYDVALLPQWGEVKPFAVNNVQILIPAPPPALSSQVYADSLNEVRSLGRATGSTRTVDQTQIARFWADGGGTYTPPGHWNQIASQFSTSQGLSVGEKARLFAMLNVALGDAAIVSWSTKYKYELWRPITAIQGADQDNNNQTTADPTWSSLLITPPFPEYTSGHSTFSGAAAEVLTIFFGDNQSFKTTSVGLPGVTRNFTSFNQAANEAGRSRVYGGIHFEFTDQISLVSGHQIGREVLNRFTVADDTRAPQIVFLAPPNGSVSNVNPTVQGWALDNLAGVASAEVRVDNSTFVNVTLDASGRFSFQSTLATNGSADGQHVLHFRARDKAGLQSSEFDFMFTLDTLAPTIAIASPIEGSSVSPGQILEGTASGTGSNLVSLTYQIDSNPRMPIRFSQSTDRFSQTLDMSRLAVGVHTLIVSALDAAGLSKNRTIHFTLTSIVPSAVISHTPLSGSSDVGSTFRPQVFFSRPINTTTLSANNFFATDTTGAKIPATIVRAQDGSFAWLFFTNPLPGGSTISVHVNGETILGTDGSKLDADGNGTAGGELVYRYTTVSLAPLPGTSLSGRVVDPGNDLKPMTFDDIRAGVDGVLHSPDDVFLNPIAHAKVFILGLESQFVFTDANGLFTFSAVPGGNIKLAVDGRTATNALAGTFWPEMVLDLEMEIGRAISWGRKEISNFQTSLRNKQ